MDHNVMSQVWLCALYGVGVLYIQQAQFTTDVFTNYYNLYFSSRGFTLRPTVL